MTDRGLTGCGCCGDGHAPARPGRGFLLGFARARAQARWRIGARCPTTPWARAAPKGARVALHRAWPIPCPL